MNLFAKSLNCRKPLCLAGLFLFLILTPGYILADEKNEPQFLNVPTKLAFDQQNSLIYVLNTSFISVFDARDYSFIKKIEISNPLDFYLDNLSKKIYITTANADKSFLALDLVSKDNLLQAKNTSVPAIFIPGDLLIKVFTDYSKNRAYVFIKNASGNRLSIIDLKDEAILGNIDIPYDIFTYSEADYLPSTGKLYMLTKRGGDLLILNPEEKSIKNIKSPLNGWQAFSLDKERKKAYALTGDSLFVIDDSQETVSFSKAFGRTLYRVFYDKELNKILITDWVKGVLTFVDPNSFNTEREIVLPPGSAPEFLTYAGNQKKIYVANSGINSFSIIDVPTYSILKNIKSSPNPVRELTVNPITGDVIMPSSWYFSNMLFVVKPDNQILEVPNGGEPFLINFLDTIWSISVNKNSGILYLVNNIGKYSKLTALDPSATKILWTIPVGENPRDLIIDYNKNLLYLVCSDEDTVFVINQENGEILKKIAVKGKPVSMVSDSGLTKIFTANVIDDTVSVINAKTGMVEADIKVGRGPKNLFLDEKNNLLYAWNTGEKSVSLIDLGKNGVGQTIFSEDKNIGSVSSLFLGSSSGKVYVIDYYGAVYEILRETKEFKLVEKAGDKQYVDAVLSGDGKKIYLADRKGKAVDIFYTDGNIPRKTIDLKSLGTPAYVLIGKDQVFAMLDEGIIAVIDSSDTFKNSVLLNGSAAKAQLPEKYRTWRFSFRVPSFGFKGAYSQKDSMIYFPMLSPNLGGLGVFDVSTESLSDILTYENMEKIKFDEANPNVAITFWQNLSLKFKIIIALVLLFLLSVILIFLRRRTRNQTPTDSIT